MKIPVSQLLPGVLFGRGHYQAEQQPGHPQENQADAFVSVAHRRAEKPVSQKMHAPIPWFDYRMQGFSPVFAREFAEKAIARDGTGSVLTGKHLLEQLVTDVAILPSSLPTPERIDFPRFGVPETSLREWAEKHHVPVYELHDALQEAFRLGLVYRMTDLKNKTGYVGVPYSVRTHLALTQPKAKTAVKDAAQATDTEITHPQQALMLRLAEAALSLPPADKPELLEFTAQLTKAAVNEGLLKPENLSKKYLEATQVFDFMTPTFEDALLTLSEALAVSPHLKQHPFYREGMSLAQMHPRALDLVQMV